MKARGNKNQSILLTKPEGTWRQEGEREREEGGSQGVRRCCSVEKKNRKMTCSIPVSCVLLGFLVVFIFTVG